ncbi:D-glycero-beta-D-manno-heptose 1,7-bisphosphate 7-phosphatase [Anaerobiospirillum sp. NML120449]|uniref:D-glycero-beta-D-manno-heptose 1,7-bisphosphate 7-phosphatase n=1 Tax=Anaerobiospirillum sp. NML120449 TaxID=2932817 RepID=UPI001FF1239F|nr:D-glycero-beta-D-manno-heptose 1,7-bisphosphate 7-phosphatase [Anaerobiospirillum sp. NML120449]
MHKAVFFDRDGVINRDHGYVGTLERFEFIPGVAEALAAIKKACYKTILVTNQSGIARGLYTVDDFDTVTEFMQGQLAMAGAAFDGVYFCPHHPNATVAKFRCDCSCRKPKPEMFLWARKEFDLDMENSVMVGDHASDLQAAQAAGVKRLVLVGEHIETELKHFPQAETFNSLPEFAMSFCRQAG